MTKILKVLVGSRAHGVAREDSDYDYRGVFLANTRDMLGLNTKIKSNHWIEGDEDNTSWEIGKFLNLALDCNPTILEVFHAPVVRSTELGHSLRSIFKHVWTKRKIYQSHMGYANSQRKKFYEDKDTKWRKFAQAWLRVVYQALNFFETGEYIVDFKGTEVYDTLLGIRDDSINRARAMEICESYEKQLKSIYDSVEDNSLYDADKVNDMLVKARLRHSECPYEDYEDFED